ncbi:S-layer homology domain-containing protein [Paenibacillus thalictri]|uniref:S-layer homology domain-containing protein n=1 Tax=Paenibacillus thalictri TaxID=2527873 RepID=A0A4Q9DJE1_9BACL|nr:S-layer homology domain-containing protein [Paenibacillus thalictri]TBL71553.1 hypothetical protein EYB31_29685 [Paenibacillus thalictri]
MKLLDKTATFRLFTLLVCITLSLSLMGREAHAFGGGSGTQLSPYLITSSTDLRNINNNSTAHYKLAADIVLTGEWTPLNLFKGSLDGDGHTISNLTITSASDDRGLFSEIGAGGAVKNLKLTNVNITGTDGNRKGALAGKITDGTVTQVHVVVSEITGTNGIGGLVGNTLNATTITESSVTGTDATSIIQGGSSTSSLNIGGMAGANAASATIESSFTNIHVTSANGIAGGLVGFNLGTILNSIASGDVTGGRDLGGLIGSHNGLLKFSYATGNVTGDSGNAGKVGGLIGSNGYTATYTPRIENSFAAGKAAGPSNVGGLIGFNQTTATFAGNSYFNTDDNVKAIGNQTTSSVTGKTIAELKQAATYTGWDPNVWSPENGSYPILKAMPPSGPEEAAGMTVTAADVTGASNNGKTKISVAQTVGVGNKNVYKNEGSGTVTIPKVGDTLSGYTDLPSDGIIVAVNGDKIAIAEVDAAGKAMKFGQTIAVVVTEREVNYAAGVHGTVSSPKETVAHGGNPVSVPAVTPTNGYKFAGWSTDGGVTLLTAVQVGATTVTADITYTAYYAAVANTANNSMNASPTTAAVGDSITLTATGDRQSISGSIRGDERYIPVSWTSSETGKSGTFAANGGTYISAYVSSAAETYTVTATFQKQEWDGISWSDVTGQTNTKTANVTVNAFGTVTVLIGSVSGVPGENVTVPVSLAQASSSAGSYGIRIVFDAAALEVADIFDPADNLMFAANHSNTDGWLMAAWSEGLTPAKEAGDTLFHIRFNIKQTASLGDKALTVADESDINQFSMTNTNAIEMVKTLTVGKVTVFPALSITTGPDNQTADEGGTVHFTVVAAGATDYKWQVNTGSGFTNITDEAPYSGTSTSTLTVTGVSKAMSGYQYRAVASGALSQSKASASAALTVNQIPEEPTIVDAAAGNAKVTLIWNPVSGATGYKVYKSETSGLFGDPITSVSESAYRYDVTGLINGTTYYFVIKAANPGGDSTYSNEVSAIPQALTPGIPNLYSAIAGNAHVQLSWTPVPGSTGYTVYRSVASQVYGTEVGTVAGSVYSYDAAGLTNGVAYYFVVKAAIVGGDSSYSNELSAIPATVPAAPIDISSVAGSGRATVFFNGPADNGGSVVTGYEVTASPGDLVVTGSASPITITGLTNGTSYTFTVKAINRLGKSISSEASAAVIPWVPSSGSGGSSSQPSTPSAPEPANTDAAVYVNGKAESAGTAATVVVNGQQVTRIVIDEQKLQQLLEAEGERTVILIPVNTASAVVVGELNGRMVKSMEAHQAVVEIRTGQAAYTLPAQQINIDAISERFGTSLELKDVKIRIEIATPPNETVQVVQNAAAANGLEIVVPPLNFSVKALYGDRTEEVAKFNAYVKRTIAIPEGVDPNRMTTGVVIEPDGAVRHVPTKIVYVDGKYYAEINSLSNSTYTLVWRPLQFKDVADHWAKAAINNMGSRMVVSGASTELFSPDQDITRAEFAAIVVRSLGLRLENGETMFTDVRRTAWYSSAIQTAYAYRLINGFEDGTFRPEEKVTREQAMQILSKTMAITKLQGVKPGQSANLTIHPFVDAENVSSWALNGVADNVSAGIISGRSGETIAPEAYITRAEVAVVMQRLLQKSALIND